MLENTSGLSQGWILTISASVLCVLGCMVIFMDDIYRSIFPRFITRRYKFELKENYQFLISSLSFSSGCLLFTSLYRLLPQAQEYIQESETLNERGSMICLMTSFLGGMVICLLLDIILHVVTSDSVIHHHDHGDGHGLDHGSTQELNLSGSFHHDNVKRNRSTEGTEETAPLITNTVKRSGSLWRLLDKSHDHDMGDCKGFSSADKCPNNCCKKTSIHSNEFPALGKHSDEDEDEDNNDDDDDEELAIENFFPHIDPTSSNQHSHFSQHNQESPPHHHHVSSSMSKLLLIGIQTTLAIVLHKLPEGFITYITSMADSKLGIEIFLSLSLHNFIEGFLMCLPLYYLFCEHKKKSSFNNQIAKWKALLISGGLGGLAQPLGAFMGVIFLKYNSSGPNDDINDLDYIFGILMAVTSGFLTIVGLSMFASAVAFNGNNTNGVVIWCLFGIVVIGGSGILTASV